MTRNWSASAARVGRKEPLVPPSPWTARTGGPWPASIVEILWCRVATVRNRSRPSCAAPLVAARKPTPRCRSRRTDSRPAWKAPIPPRRSRAIAAQVLGSAVRVASGWPDAGSSRAVPLPTTASNASSPSTFRRTRAVRDTGAKTSGSYRSTSARSASGAGIGAKDARSALPGRRGQAAAVTVELGARAEPGVGVVRAQRVFRIAVGRDALRGLRKIRRGQHVAVEDEHVGARAPGQPVVLGIEPSRLVGGVRDDDRDVAGGVDLRVPDEDAGDVARRAELVGAERPVTQL